MSVFKPIFQILNTAEVRYVVVGGLATVLHGYARLTADVDVAVDLAPEEATKMIQALVARGFRPQVRCCLKSLPIPQCEKYGSERSTCGPFHLLIRPIRCGW